MSDYTLIPKVTEDGDLPPLVEGRLFSKIGRSFPGAIRASEGGSVDVSGDIQAWLDDNAGKVCVLPAGTWGVSTPLRVHAGTTLRGEPGAVVHSLDPNLEAHVKAFGSYLSSTKKEIAAEVGVGDRTITTKTAHGYAVGDVVRIVSQRVGTNQTDAGEWQLGWKTVGGQGPFFAEFGRVYSVPNSTTIVLDSGLIFPGYRPNATQETDADAGTSAYLIKTNGSADNVVVDGVRLTGPSSYGVRVIRSVQPLIKNVTQDKPDSGRHIGFEDCYLGEARDGYVLNRNMPVGQENHAIQNSCHIIGSQSTGFRNVTVIRGAQSFDITYSSTSPYASVGCYVDTCKSPSNLFNPLTLHPGTYACKVTNNDFIGCQISGVSIRGNSSIVTGNTILGAMQDGDTGTDNPGIYIFEGGGKNSIVSDNIVENFRTAIRVNDGGDKPFPGWIGVTFENNKLRNFNVGFKRIVQWATPVPDRSQGVTLRHNQFESSRPGAIGVETCEGGRGINGLVVDDNDFRLTATDSTGIVVTANSRATVVKGNTFHEVGRVLRYDATATATVQSVVHWSGNTVLRAISNQWTSAPTADFAVASTDNQLLQIDDTAWHLDNFMHDGRWKTGSNALVVPSRGFPVNNTLGWLEVVSMAQHGVEQTFHKVNSVGSERWTRRYVASWSNWVAV